MTRSVACWSPNALGVFKNCKLAVATTALLMGNWALGAAPSTPDPGQNPYANIPQVQKINELIRQVWGEYELTPSKPATDGEWCRRVFLDVVGRIPTVQELTAFVESSEPDKKRRLVNELIYDEKYTEEYARNWTTLWTNVLIGRSGGTERRTLTSREGMQKYLRDSFARNKPYDNMVLDLITATGTSAPGGESFNGAVNFLAMKVNDEDGTLATSATSKIFLGLQIQCTQCHNHPFNDWKQQKFWEFNAFFRQTRSLRRFVQGTRDVSSIELVNQDYGGDGGGDPEQAEVFYELRNGEMKAAYPVFIDGTALTDVHGQQKGNSGFVEDVTRRTDLGKMVIESEYLEKMVANRMWAHFMGYGFTKPIDDLGPHNPSSHPELLDYLGHQVREHSFNLKELVSWIVLSEPYSLSSVMNDSNHSDDPLLGETPKFSHFYLRQMRAEELYESLLTATQAEKTRGNYEEQERTKGQWLQQFVTAFGTDEGDETTTFNGTIPQVLMMFNGDLVKRATGTGQGSMVWKVASSSMQNNKKIDYLFLAGLARTPTRTERRAADALLGARVADNRSKNQPNRQRNRNRQNRARNQSQNPAVAAALQDVWWAVLNSNEFIFNH